MDTILKHLSPQDVNDYDYIIVGGGTAGCVVGSRLAEYLPSKMILVVEAGPSDLGDKRISKLREWIDLLGTELDFDYAVTEQKRGKIESLPVRQRG